MIKYVDEIIDVLCLFIENKINIYELTEWAEMKYNLFFEREDYKILNYRAINDVLFQIRDLLEESSPQKLITHKEKLYFQGEVKGMIRILKGQENYFEIYKIKEKFSGNYKLISEVLEKQTTIIMRNDIVPDEELIKIKNYIVKQKQVKREDVIIFEYIQTLLHLNEAIRVNSEEVFRGLLGECKVGLKVREEQYYLKRLSEVMNGEREYRLSLGLNGTSIIYTNIVVL